MSKEKLNSNLSETNVVGSGAVAGLGVGPDGEPGVTNKNKIVLTFQTILRRKSK